MISNNITNGEVTNYINGFYKPLNQQMEALRKSAEENHIPIILKETESFLEFVVKATAPRRILEIGTAVGYSAAFFACLGADVVTVEKSEEMAGIAAGNIKRLGLEEKVTILTGDGEEAIRQNIKEGDLFDMVFIDAAKSHYKRFLDASLPFCHENTLIVSDNVLLKGATASDSLDIKGRFKTNIKRMRQYLDYIEAHPRLDTVIISCGDGLALSRCIR